MACGRNVHCHAAAAEDDAVVVQFGFVLVAAEVESRLAVQLEAHLTAHHPNHPYQAMPIGNPVPRDRHEVDDLTYTISAQEPGDQDRRPRQVQLPGHVVGVDRPDPEMTALPRIQQRREDGWRVEPRCAEPVDRAVVSHQSSGLQIADQPMILDSRVRGHDNGSPSDAVAVVVTSPVPRPCCGRHTPSTHHRVTLLSPTGRIAGIGPAP